MFFLLRISTYNFILPVISQTGMIRLFADHCEKSKACLCFRGDHGPSDRALSLAVHCVEHDAFIFALCQDHKLRMWSYKVSTTLMVGIS